jgi:hypothetical protein
MTLPKVLLISLLVAFCASAGTHGIAWYDIPDISQYGYVDQENKIPELAKKKALAYYELYKDRISNKDYVTVFDVSQISGKPRLFVIHMPTGKIESYLVAHGRGSDANHDGYADKFSNVPNSKATSLGFYMTANPYIGDNGYSLRLQGVEESNSNAWARAIVIHGAAYVSAKVAASSNKVGRSLGCPAVEKRYARPIIDKIKGGSVLYIWKG